MTNSMTRSQGAWFSVTSYPLQSDAPSTAGSCDLKGGGSGHHCIDSAPSHSELSVRLKGWGREKQEDTSSSLQIHTVVCMHRHYMQKPMVCNIIQSHMSCMSDIQNCLPADPLPGNTVLCPGGPLILRSWAFAQSAPAHPQGQQGNWGCS